MKQYKHLLNWEKMLFIAHVTVFYHQSMTEKTAVSEIRQYVWIEGVSFGLG